MEKPHWFGNSPSIKMSAATYPDNKEASEAKNDEVKNALLNIKSQSQSTEKKNSPAHDIGTLFYDGNNFFLT